MKDCCFAVGGSEPVAHCDGLLSWEDILGGGVCFEGCEIAVNVLDGVVSLVTTCGSMTDTFYSWRPTILGLRKEGSRMFSIGEKASPL